MYRSESITSGSFQSFPTVGGFAARYCGPMRFLRVVFWRFPLCPKIHHFPFLRRMKGCGLGMSVAPELAFLMCAAAMVALLMASCWAVWAKFGSEYAGVLLLSAVGVLLV